VDLRSELEASAALPPAKSRLLELVTLGVVGMVKMHTYRMFRKKVLNLIMVRLGIQQFLPDCKAVKSVSDYGTLVGKIIGMSKITFKIKDDLKFRKIVFSNNFIKIKNV
jgi:hypothetical protein